MNSRLCFSLDLSRHPILSESLLFRELYYSALEYSVTNIKHSQYTDERLYQYRNFFNIQGIYKGATLYIKKNLAEVAVKSGRERWKTDYLYIMFCDLFMVTANGAAFKAAGRQFLMLLEKDVDQFKCDLMLKNWSSRLFKLNNNDSALWGDMASLIRENYWFTEQPEKRIIVTSTISAGKSTVINALIGKRVAKTSSGVCTGNLGYYYNKPFEDNIISVSYNNKLYLSSDQEFFLGNEWKQPKLISTYFRSTYTNNKRICLIDTPGVNASTNTEHMEIAQKAILNEKFDICICVLSAKSLGSTDEWRHLKWLRQNVLPQKMVFVLNMLDLYDIEDDCFDESLDDVKKHLKKLDYVSPTICPLSAKCAYYSKTIQYGESISEREVIDYHDMVRKFSYDDYDLSQYYGVSVKQYPVCEEMVLRQKCGFDGFEKILFGG